MNFSKEYYHTIDLYKQMHQENVFNGYSLHKWIDNIKDTINVTKAKSIIDFGCGKAELYKQNIKQLWNVNDITLYDPGVEKFSSYPQSKADGVICIDVLEHITSKDVNEFINQLYALANKFVFIVVCTRPAKKHFKDGRNVHLTLKNEEQWNKIFNKFDNKYKNIHTIIKYNE